MNYFDGLIIVEGHNDEEYLSSFIYSTYLVLNGYAFKKEDIDFVQHASQKHKIILLTDGDQAGQEIRNKINNLVPNLINVIVPVDECTKGLKNGIFECPKSTLIKYLQGFLTKKYVKNNNITPAFIHSVCIGETNKNDLCRHFHLGNCNTKKLIERLNFLNVSQKDLMEYYGNK